MIIKRIVFWIAVLFCLCVGAEYNIEDLEWNLPSDDGVPRGFYLVKELGEFLTPFINKGFLEGKGVAQKPMEKIGQGKYGITYKIYWPGYVGGAIAKLIHKESVARHEASILAYLDEAAGAPKLIVYQSQTGSMVMEYVGSFDMSKLGKIGLSKNDMLLVFMSLTQRLNELHNLGVVHGNLKFDNVMVSFDAQGLPQIHFVDFGLSSLSGIREGLVSRRKDWKDQLAARPWYSKEFYTGLILDYRADFPGLAYIMRKLMPNMETECKTLFQFTGRATDHDREARPYLDEFFKVLLEEYQRQERKIKRQRKRSDS